MYPRIEIGQTHYVWMIGVSTGIVIGYTDNAKEKYKIGIGHKLATWSPSVFKIPTKIPDRILRVFGKMKLLGKI